MFEEGVLLFFILSGYLISISLENTKNIKSFFIKRFARIYPTYIFCILLTFLFVKTFNLPDRDSNLVDIFYNSLFLNQFKSFNSIDGVYWSLAVEINFYVIISLFFYYFKSLNKSFFLLTLISLCFNFTTQLFEWNSLEYYNQVIMFPKYIGMFLIGYLFYLHEKKELNPKHLLCYIPFIIYSIYLNQFKLIYNLYIPIAVLFFFICYINKYKFLKIPKILKFYALISYPLYLIHQNIGVILIRQLAVYNLNDHLKIVISFLTLSLISYLIHLIIETPLNELLRKKLLD